ncbi:MAG: plasmid stabilization protein [Phyllobacteriaceae bacterium]|nr:plasmid stabilization protein [Phyllobacteriaceae bacterium]
MKTIIFTHQAARDLDGLPSEARQSVEAGLVRYAVSGEGDVRNLSGRDGFRLRVGRYRVLFDEDRSTILAIYIGKRETTTYR